MTLTRIPLNNLAAATTANKKLRALHLAPDKAVGASWHNGFWGGVSWDPEFIVKWLDHAKRLKANAVGIKGSAVNVLAGTISFATYEARVRYVLDQAHKRDLYVYFTTLGRNELSSASGYAIATVDTFLGDCCTVLNDYPNVVGVDLVNELSNAAPVLLETAATYVNTFSTTAAAALDSDLSYSFDVPATSSADFTGSFAQSLNGKVTHFDFHPYFSFGDPATADLTAFRAAAYYEPFIVGECGLNAMTNATNVAARWQALATLSAAADSFGCVYFAAAQYDATDDYGLFTSPTGVPRRAALGPFRSSPVTF